MKNNRKTVFFLCTLLPFSAWLIYFFISSAYNLFAENGILLTAFIVYCAECIISIGFSIIKYKFELGAMNGRLALIITLINAFALVFMLCSSYAAGYAYAPSPCSVLLCAGSVPVLYWAVLTASKKEAMTAKTLKRQLLLCILLPLAVAFGLNFSPENIAETILMNAGAAMLTAAVCFVMIYAFAPFKASDAATGGDSAEFKPESSFYKFCYNNVLVIIFAIILPQICLWVNLGSANLLGNYADPLFFIIAFLNGILMLPAVEKKLFSLPYLYLKCVCFALITYFTIAFIPILPLGLIGIIVMGLGLLIFVPLFIFIMETGQIYYETQKLKTKWKFGALLGVIILGIATIPAIFCLNAVFDKINLINALTYLDPYNQTYPAVDTQRLMGTIEKSNKVNYRTAFVEDLFENGTPMADGIYREIVLDGAYLTDDAKSKLNTIFNPDYFESYSANETYDPLIDAERGDESVKLKFAQTDTYYDSRAGAWATDITLTIKNDSDSNRSNREFSADFYFPEGLIISDFWLDIDGYKSLGLITDKRAALMTYDSVVRAKQDPGIIFYKDNNILQLNVFPFGEGEVRECGFTVLHSDFELLEIDGVFIPLEPGDKPEITEFDGGALIPAQLLSEYPESGRKPYYCFAVDMSADSRTEDLLERLKEYIKAAHITDGMIYFANEKVTPVPLSELENVVIKDDKVYIGNKMIIKSGGYNLSGAFGAAQIDALKIKDEFYPALIAVTRYEGFGSRVLSQSDFLSEFPENDRYYVLSMYGNTDYLTAYDIANNAELGYANAAEDAPCVVTPYGIAANDGNAQIVYNKNVKPQKISLYSDALALYANSLENPYDISNVKDSIYMNVLCPSTAFSVFETNEQIAQLEETQKRILEGEYITQKAQATAVSMDEGSDVLFIATASFVIAAVLFKRKKMKKSAADKRQ